MKNFLLGAGVVIFIGATVTVYLFGKNTQSSKTLPSLVSPTAVIYVTVSPAPSPTSEAEKENTSELIKQALIKKNNWQDDGIIVKVSTNDGKYSSGTVSAGGGGGYFYAAKVAGVWEIVADGNGVILCVSLAKYPNYPKNLIPECFDQTSGQSVKR